MSISTDSLFSAWHAAAEVVIELIRLNPALIAVLVLVGLGVAYAVHFLRSRIWIPLFINGDYRQSGGNFCICLVGLVLHSSEL